MPGSTPAPTARIAMAPMSGTASSNLAFALGCLPRSRREHALVFYRFCRAVDDVADSPSDHNSEKLATLTAWHSALSTGEGVPEELAQVIHAYAIPKGWLLAIVEGCLADVEGVRYADMAALRSYCWKVACAVGLASARIFGCSDPATTAYAEHLGYALQFTNILRDVGEDARMGRVYLPEDLLAAHGLDRRQILEGPPHVPFRAAARSFAAVARSEFQAAVPPAADRRALLPAEIMGAIYRRLLENIERSNFAVLDRRFRVPGGVKGWLAARTWLASRMAAR